MEKRLSDQQIISILHEAEAGASARELCRKHSISDATFYAWRKKYGGMEMPEEENARLKITGMDDFTKECLTVTVTFGISGVQVTCILDSIALFVSVFTAPPENPDWIVTTKYSGHYP